jgi:hypothetical protein
MSRRVTAPDENRTALPAALITLLVVPWFVHAAVVICSAAGAHPLAGSIYAVAILGMAGGVAAVTLRGLGHALPPSEPERSTPPVSKAIATGIATAAAVATLIAVVAAVVLPLVAYDALGYRLPVIADWLDAGRIAWVDTDDPVRNGYPMGQEAVSAVVAAAVGSLRFSAIPSFLHVLAGALSIWLLAEHAGARRPLARAAAAAFVLVPMNLLNAASGYVDAAFAGAVVALACNAALLATAGQGLFFAVSTGMAAAHVLSLKGNGIAVVGVVGLALAVGAIFRRQPARHYSLALALAAPGAFWALRNVARMGNPLWPVQVKLAGRVVLPGTGTMESILDVAHNTPHALVRLSGIARVIHTWLELAGPAGDCDDRLSGLGWAWPLLALPALATMLFSVVRRERRTEQWAGVLFVTLVTAFCFALQPMKWWPRYTIWVWGPGALALALAGERIARTRSTRTLSLSLAVLAVLVIGEGTTAALRANGLGAALARARGGAQGVSRVQTAGNGPSWVHPDLWSFGVAAAEDVCRGAWKPGTDNANLDGVIAQLVPRPHVHVINDDADPWATVKARWKKTPCRSLLLFTGTHVLADAERDPEVTVTPTIAFDPLYVVRPRAPTGSEVASPD